MHAQFLNTCDPHSVSVLFLLFLRHALPAGYVLKSQMKELLEAEAAKVRDMRRLPSLFPISLESPSGLFSMPVISSERLA